MVWRSAIVAIESCATFGAVCQQTVTCGGYGCLETVSYGVVLLVVHSSYQASVMGSVGGVAGCHFEMGVRMRFEIMAFHHLRAHCLERATDDINEAYNSFLIPSQPTH